jgi:hypothetical protein
LDRGGDGARDFERHRNGSAHGDEPNTVLSENECGACKSESVNQRAWHNESRGP